LHDSKFHIHSEAQAHAGQYISNVFSLKKNQTAMLASSDEEVLNLVMLNIFLTARARDSVEWRSLQKRFRRKQLSWVKDESIGSINKLS
jgi:hypothetical protein